MGTMIALIACVPAYLAAIAALLMGAGWLTALAVLSGTGVGFALFGIVLVTLRADASQQGKTLTDIKRATS